MILIQHAFARPLQAEGYGVSLGRTLIQTCLCLSLQGSAPSGTSIIPGSVPNNSGAASSSAVPYVHGMDETHQR